MNREDIIRMAREAGLAQWSEFAQADAYLFAMPDRIERFAALVAAHEREACARLCDEFGFVWPSVAVAIRARSEA